MRYPGNAQKSQIWPVSLSERGTIIRKVNRASPKLISSEGGQEHQHTNVQDIASMRSPENARKPRIWPISLSQNSTKIWRKKNIISWLYSNHFWRWSGTSACKISGHSLHAFSGKWSETQICPVSLSQRATIMRKINGAPPKTNQLWKLSGYISIQKFRPFPLCVLTRSK